MTPNRGTIYTGRRILGAIIVEATTYTPDGTSYQGRTLDPRNDLRNHSPVGFDWGYEGSGPAQLALAILADYFGAEPDLLDGKMSAIVGKGAVFIVEGDGLTVPDRCALRWYQWFKRRVVASLARDAWAITTDEITAALAAIHAEIGAPS